MPEITALSQRSELSVAQSSLIKVGISACVVGQNVRFDGGHKASSFVTKVLQEYFSFIPICPEMAIGMDAPRPAIRLISEQERISLVETKNPEIDYTQAMEDYAHKQVHALLKEELLCGYIVCAKSPSCGMERVKVYTQHNAVKDGVGIYTRILMKKMPWLPIEEDGRLNDPVLKENFMARIYCLADFYQAMDNQPSRKKIVNFHSRYKLTLMAHHPTSYKQLGQLVANIANYELEEFYHQYRLQLMQALTHRASRQNNTNVLMHIQGYFKRALNSEERQELATLIHDYRTGLLPLLSPLTLIQHYLKAYPDEYLSQQAFLAPYPQDLRLRYGL